MITADNITDEQIRELRDATDPKLDPMTRAVCDAALVYGKRFGRGQRARCAEILNARAASGGGK